MKLEKWQALGNDYLIVERSEVPWPLTAPRIRRLCHEHLGFGSDGICELSDPEEEGCVARLAIFNPDGSRAELSGNGVREVALYLHARGRTSSDRFGIETDAGMISPEILSPTMARVDMGRASLSSSAYPQGSEDGRGQIDVAGSTWKFQHVSVGNPQCAIEVPDGLLDLDIGSIGAEIEVAEIFPERTNVSFWRREDADGEGGSRIRTRIFERGVGETLSSGTGATGAAVAAVCAGMASPMEVVLDGGSLTVEVGRDLEIHLTGEAQPVYTASASPDLMQALEAETDVPDLTGSA